VVAIREAALSHLDDIPVVVAEMEMTEENLSDVLRDRVLTSQEGRQVLDAVLAALGAMHAHGLVHRHVESASVVATGETIKLRSDCLQMAGSSFGTAAADDVRWAARMVAHAVTGRFPANENDPVLQLLPESMARAVRRALSGIAGASEVAALAGTRLEIARDATRIEPLSKAARRMAAVDAPDLAKKIEAAVDATVEKAAVVAPPTSMPGAVKMEAKPAVPAQRVLAMRSMETHGVDAQIQGGLFDEPLTLPTERVEASGNDEEPGMMSRWPKAPYVIVAAIAVVLVTVFTLYGLLHGQASQQPQPAPATTAAVTVPGQ